MNTTFKRTALAVSVAALLPMMGCGGGGSGTGSVAAPTTVDMTVTPSLGRFSDGTMVELRDLNDKLIGTPKAIADGSVTFPAVPNTGPVVVTVLGSSTATYYDEGKTGENRQVAFGVDKKLTAVASAPRSKLGVTALTHAAAVRVGVLKTATVDDINGANAKVATVFGLSDILAAPTAVSGTTTKLDLSSPADNYALMLAALAKTGALSGKNAEQVASALALDLKDDKLDGLDATSTTSPTTPLGGYSVSNITTAHNSAAQEFANENGKTFIQQAPFVPVTTTVSVPTPALTQAKALFSELRTTLNSFSNGTNGFLDTQAVTMGDDIKANVAPDFERLSARLEGLGNSVEKFDDAKDRQLAGFSSGQSLALGGTPAATAMVGTSAAASLNNNINNVMRGFGSFNYCWTDSPTALNTTLTCAAAGNASGDPGFNRVKMIVYTLTRAADSKSYAYTATRYNLPVTFQANTSTWVRTGTAATLASVPTGSGTVTRNATLSSDSTAFAFSGTLPPSATTSTGNAATGRDTINITLNRNGATPVQRVAMTGTVSTVKLNTAGTAEDPTRTTTLTLASGSFADVDQTTDNMVLAKIIGEAQTLNTKVVGSIDMSGFKRTFVGDWEPSNMVIEGKLSDSSANGAGQILTGKLTVAVSNSGTYNSFLPETDTNFLKGTVSFLGTIQAPSRPIVSLTLAVDRTARQVSAVTLNYSYGTVSITGSGSTSATPANDSMTLSNQDGVQWVTKTGIVSKGGVTLGTISNGRINYNDGSSVSLN